MDDTTRESWGRTILKYFAHGLLFSLLITVLIFGSLFAGVFLILLGGIIGLLIFLVGLIILLGVANNLINRAVWGDSMNWSIPALLIHGLGLFVALLIANVVIEFLPQMFFPGLTTTIIMGIPANILDGRVCRWIAQRWVE